MGNLSQQIQNSLLIMNNEFEYREGNDEKYDVQE
jgi:hypothetical protein